MCAGPACGGDTVVGMPYMSDEERGCEFFAGCVKVSEELMARMETLDTGFECCRLGAGLASVGNKPQALIC